MYVDRAPHGSSHARRASLGFIGPVSVVQQAGSDQQVAGRTGEVPGTTGEVAGTAEFQF